MRPSTWPSLQSVQPEATSSGLLTESEQYDVRGIQIRLDKAAYLYEGYSLVNDGISEHTAMQEFSGGVKNSSGGS